MKRLLPVLAATALLASAVPSATTASGLSELESGELQMSYSLLTSEFYKKVDAQVTLDGARSEIVTYLQKSGIKLPHVAAMHAGDDASLNAKQLEREVSAVVGTYGSKAGGSRAITYQAIAGMLSSVKDKYTTFLTPAEYKQLNEGLDGGNFSGVGIAIGIDEKTKELTVNDVIAGGPAEKAGLQTGDVITAVDGKPTKGLASDQDAKLLRGEKGTIVHLTIERAGATIPVIAVTRDVIHQPSVYSKLLDNGIGYARLTVFGSNTASELSAALTKLDGQGAKAYVLDLRDNGGGYLNAAIDVSSKFIASGPIVSVESRGGSNTQYDAENTAVPPKPLAVLVNKYTASASEITSGAIQDNGVGELIGEKTYGKGVVQTIHPLPDGSAVKITSARYLTPKGRDINLIGIQPDITAAQPKTAKFGDPLTDPQLQSAITYLQGKIAATGT
ncbi:MAG: S41 family peptidase [Candidatus Eremiobacteraeota bacterium]|nr:S41 family peptidase [Candidatus Eremiobacteraeota bacterium]